jgi:Carboxypeptidase regulatory-like domain
VQRGRHPELGALILAICVCALQAGATFGQANSGSGKLTGVVRDSSGIPQMGASVELVPESSLFAASKNFLTNTQGVFRGEKLSPGMYTLRVTLAGFLPSLQQHIHVSPNITTVVRVEMESVFASLDQLRKQPPNNSAEADDWKWVLRSASSMRPVLNWQDSDQDGGFPTGPDSGSVRSGRMRLELTDGARRAASASNIAPAPATAFAYEQELGGASRLILAGQMSYDTVAPGGGIATVWLPSGTLGAGPHTALVLREARISPTGPVFRGVRFDQGGAMRLSDNAVLEYGGEYVAVGVGRGASAIRPRMNLTVHATDDWTAKVIFASMPTGPAALEGDLAEVGGELAAALDQLDAFPALLWRNGRPVLENGWHEEVAAERKLGTRGKLEVAAFHDDNRHVAVYGRGNDLPTADYFQDYFTSGFAYDGGSASTWGTRVALTEKLNDSVDVTAVYAFAGALTPIFGVDGPLRDALDNVPRHSVAGSFSAKLPGARTRVEAGYKWVNGVTVSRVDLYGESLYQTAPYLHVGLRQPLPHFVLGHWEAVADCDNLLAQGYVPTSNRDGHALLVSAFRTFRGGLNVQF